MLNVKYFNSFSFIIVMLHYYESEKLKNISRRYVRKYETN